jgi:hypothetical protein
MFYDKNERNINTSRTRKLSVIVILINILILQFKTKILVGFLTYKQLINNNIKK